MRRKHAYGPFTPSPPAMPRVLKAWYWSAAAVVCTAPAILSVLQGIARSGLDGRAISWDNLLWDSFTWLLLGILAPFAFLVAPRLRAGNRRWRRIAAVNLSG